jgi:DNA-directed RNA polymerase alpha subunit
MIKVENNIINVNGITIEFDSKEGVNSFLLDYISKHEQQVIIPTVEKVTVSLLDSLIDSFGAIEIENLDLSVRSFNCLKRAGINNIEQIIRLDYPEIARVRNLGRASVREIQVVVNDYMRHNYIEWTRHDEYTREAI